LRIGILPGNENDDTENIMLHAFHQEYPQRHIGKHILNGCGKSTFKYTNQIVLRIMFLHVFLLNGKID
jgi:hypothetical protein